MILKAGTRMQVASNRSGAMNIIRRIISAEIVLFAALAAVVLTGACNSESSATPPSTASAQTSAAQASGAALEVDVIKVTTQKLDSVQNLPGELVPYESVEIFPKVTGYVKSISVDRGSHVKQGEFIAQLEAPELLAQRAEAQSKLQAAQSQLAAAQAKLAADQGTYDKLAEAAKTPGVVAGNDLQIAAKSVDADRAIANSLEGGIAAAKGALDSVAQMESYLRITAPFDGQVTERNVHPGELVGPASGAAGATPMLRIETLARLRLVVPVPDASVADVPPGAQIKFTVPAYPAEIFQAPVARNSRAVDPKTRTMPVELEVTNASGKLTPGTYCQVQWPVRRSSPSHFVPPSAVSSNQERTFVIRVASSGPIAGKAEWVDVKTGATITTPAGPLVEVLGAINDGDMVVLRATDAIRPGAPVTARAAGSH
jgi:RND family efflux transporter MFP subunit